MFIEALHRFLEATYQALGDVPDRVEISPQMMTGIIAEANNNRRYTAATPGRGTSQEIGETFDYQFLNRTVQFRISENYRPQLRSASFNYTAALSEEVNRSMTSVRRSLSAEMYGSPTMFMAPETYQSLANSVTYVTPGQSEEEQALSELEAETRHIPFRDTDI